MNILWPGARGPAVKELQSSLKELGYDPGDIDGIFGPFTTAAVTAFQRDRNLFADGIAGPQTFNALKLPTTAPGAPRSARTKVFVSYSHADDRWLQMLQVHIAPLERRGIAVRWDDTKIAPGRKWRVEIADAIRSAKVAVLLISAYFMASEFIAENELPPLLEAAEHEGTVILPVIISPCVLGSLAEFQAVNPPSKPLVDLSRGDRDRVWVKLMEAITAALNE
jgi:Putative peptidoglycan binding domain/TIR domain